MDLSLVKPTLDSYYDETGCYIEAEEDGTTVLSAGSVLFASVLAGTRSPKVIATITGLPIGFVSAALSVSEAGGHIFSVRFADLIFAVRKLSFDVSAVEEVLTDLLVEIIENMDPHWLGVLKSLRAGYVYGGDQQPWTHEVEFEHTAAPVVIH
jgi:hypothetical protein